MRALFMLATTVAATAAAPVAGKSHVVAQKDKQFAAASISVAAGDSIVFKNDDAVVHNVFSADPNFKFNLRAQAPGSSNAITFDKPGTFQVRCAIHPTMKLAVTVAP